MNELENIIFQIISIGGTAKGLAYEALEAAEEGNYEESDELMKQADEYMLQAHHVQTKLIQEEAAGNKTEVSLLMVHAQDHLMTAIEAKTLIEYLIKMNKKINKLNGE